MDQEKVIIRISVRNLVEFILRSGDLDNRRGGGRRDAMQEGSRMHRKIQRRMGADYQAEVPLKIEFEKNRYLFVVEGRADGIIHSKLPEADEDSQLMSQRTEQQTAHQVGQLSEQQINHQVGQQKEQITIDEIKGMYLDITWLDAPIDVHLAQAKCYAYIYALQHELNEISVQMTYVNLTNEEIKQFVEHYSFLELESFFIKLVEAYEKWADFLYEWKLTRQDSIQTLEFPFDYRQGQRKLVGDVYRTIDRRKTLFIQAPTGVGKTISTVFPTVKAMGTGLVEKIFYLTAKTITRTVAKEAFDHLKEHGLRSKVVQITAKEKLCVCDTMDCNPVNCPRAKGHFDRVNDAVFDLLNSEDDYNRDVILAYAEKHMVCPFEMCLDLSSWSDVIICDYNYVFDPNVYLKRYFADNNKGDYVFLVDEAHNLVERGREMYSATLIKEDFLYMKKIFRTLSKKITNGLNTANKQMLEWKRDCEGYQIKDDIGHFYFTLLRLVGDMDDYLQEHSNFPERKEVMEFYFNLRHFMNMYELMDENYVLYTNFTEDNRFALKLYCVNPAENLQECINKGRTAVFFSATLLPIQYYKNLLSTNPDNYAVYAETVFRQEQHLLAVGSDVSSLYTRRTPEEYAKIANYIWEAANAKRGNYIVFFPSYAMMRQVYDSFLSFCVGQTESNHVETVVQSSNMNETDREAFINAFSEKREGSFLAFCVLGGIFGEGIDLKGEQLIGTIIVGTGLPQICDEREILKNYYQEKMGQGFPYAYLYPGMNKVLQAAGRVIRTVDDKGIILLLDERFLRRDYQEMFPREWSGYHVCNAKNIRKYFIDFWK